MVKGKETFEVWRTPRNRAKPSTRAHPSDNDPTSNSSKKASDKRKQRTSPSPKSMKNTQVRIAHRHASMDLQKDDIGLQKDRGPNTKKSRRESVGGRQSGPELSLKSLEDEHIQIDSEPGEGSLQESPASHTEIPGEVGGPMQCCLNYVGDACNFTSKIAALCRFSHCSMSVDYIVQNLGNSLFCMLLRMHSMFM